MLRRLRAQECSGARDLKAAGFLDLHLLLCISFRQLLSIPEFTSLFSQRTDGLNQNPFGMGVGGVWGTLTYTMTWKNAVGLSRLCHGHACHRVGACHKVSPKGSMGYGFVWHRF